MNRPTLFKAIKPTYPFYATVGAADLFIEKLLAMGGKAAKGASHLSEGNLGAGDVHKAVEGAKQAPVRAFNQTLDVFARSQNHFEDLVERGMRVVKRTRTEAHIPSGSALIHQAEETVAMGRKVAVRAADDTRKAATATVKTVRDETDHLVGDTRKAATATLKTVKAEADHVREVVTRRQLPKRPHVPTTLRRRAETKPAGDEPVRAAKASSAKPAGTKPAAAKPAAKTAARPARKTTPRKRTAAATKAAVVADTTPVVTEG